MYLLGVYFVSSHIEKSYTDTAYRIPEPKMLQFLITHRQLLILFLNPKCNSY